MFSKKLSKTPFCGFITSLKFTSNVNIISLFVVKNGNISISTTKEYVIADKKIALNKAINRFVPVDRRKRIYLVK